MLTQSDDAKSEAKTIIKIKKLINKFKTTYTAEEERLLLATEKLEVLEKAEPDTYNLFKNKEQNDVVVGHQENIAYIKAKYLELFGEELV